MENETMDSSSKITLELNPFIVDLSSKSVKSCLADDRSLHLQNVSNLPQTAANSVNNFASHNGCTIDDHHNTPELTNGNDTYNKCDDSACSSPMKISSSQCSLSFPSNAECNNLENQLSALSIDSADPNSKPDNGQSVKYDSKKCDNERLPKESVVELTNLCTSDQKSSCNVQDANASSICISETEKEDNSTSEIMYISYESEHQMPDIMKLIQKDLSEPYSIYTYRYFIHNWPHLCFLAVCKGRSVGAIVCKLDLHRKVIKRGYIAMLAVDESHRKQGIGSNLVLKAIRVMVAEGADEVVLETEITNQPALRLYENLGFVRDKRLFRYYLNGVDALRLKLWLR